MIDRHLDGPFLLKIDVQGAELAVLLGAENLLRQAEYVILEVSLFNFFDGGHVLHEVLEFMLARGLVAYDIFATLYRPLDGALSQVDMAFVKVNGSFRQNHFYAGPGQRPVSG